MSRHYGHIPDHEAIVKADLTHRPLAALPGLVRPRTGTSDVVLSYRSLLDEVPDQGGTSSCVGNAFSTSVLLRAAILGHPIFRPSRKCIYDFARLIDMPHQPMTDEGSRPAAAIMGMMTYGLTTEARWPLSEENINDDPPEDVFRQSINTKVGGHYRIAPGTGCADAIKRALNSGYCPGFAMPVDQAYEDFAGGIYQGLTGPELGGHMQCASGYGPGYIEVIGSWGRGWANLGFIRIADSFFDSGQVTDILVPTVVPGGVA